MKITVVWGVWHTAELLHMKERKRERDVLLLCLFFQVGGHTLGPIAHRLPHYFTPFAHTAKAEVTMAFHFEIPVRRHTSGCLCGSVCRCLILWNGVTHTLS